MIADNARSCPHRAGSILAAALLSIANALGATEDTFQKTLNVSPGGRLVVELDFGAIEVAGSPSNEVSIDAYRKVSLKSLEKEKEFLAERPVTVTQDGDTLFVRARKPGNAKGWSWGRGNRAKLEGKFVIHVPARFSATLNTRGDGIKVSGLTGDVASNTSGGGLRFSRIEGKVHGDTSGGAIQAMECRGELKLDTSGGEIEVDGGSGSVHADTSGGPIRVRNFDGPAHVDTSGGGITLENVRGKVAASTSGGPITAKFAEPPADEVSLETSGGGVTVALPAAASFELDAETSGGGVRSDLPVETVGKRKNDHLRGPVNGGGKLVKLRTSGGGIRVKTN